MFSLRPCFQEQSWIPMSLERSQMRADIKRRHCLIQSTHINNIFMYVCVCVCASKSKRDTEEDKYSWKYLLYSFQRDGRIRLIYFTRTQKRSLNQSEHDILNMSRLGIPKLKPNSVLQIILGKHSLMLQMTQFDQSPLSLMFFLFAHVRVGGD